MDEGSIVAMIEETNRNTRNLIEEYRRLNVKDIKTHSTTAKKEIEKQNRQCEDKEYCEANETQSVTVSDGFVTFTKNFIYIGIYVTYNLSDDYDVDRIISSAS